MPELIKQYKNIIAESAIEYNESKNRIDVAEDYKLYIPLNVEEIEASLNRGNYDEDLADFVRDYDELYQTETAPLIIEYNDGAVEAYFDMYEVNSDKVAYKLRTKAEKVYRELNGWEKILDSAVDYFKKNLLHTSVEKFLENLEDDYPDISKSPFLQRLK